MGLTVGFTGTRKGMTYRQKEAFKELLSLIAEFHHGDCIGADNDAFNIVHDQEIYTVAHPCTLSDQRAYTKSDEVQEPKAPIPRNRDIVDEVELMIAAPRTLIEEQRSGTWATIRYARITEKPMIILDP